MEIFSRYKSLVNPLNFLSKQPLSKTHINLLSKTISPLFTKQKPQSSFLPPAHSLILFNGLTSPDSPESTDGHQNLIPHPPVPFSKRMWASGSFDFKKNLCLHTLSDASLLAEKLTVESCRFSTGVNRDIIFVEEKRVLLDEHFNMEFVEERRVLAYLNEKGGHNSGGEERVLLASTLLFKYSALTFNAHKIHYDLAYTQNTEHYPDLLVHGPLACTLLLHLLSLHTDRRVVWFDYRVLKPMFCNRVFTVNGRFKKREEGTGDVFDLWCCDEGGGLTVKGQAVVEGKN